MNTTAAATTLEILAAFDPYPEPSSESADSISMDETQMLSWNSTLWSEHPLQREVMYVQAYIFLVHNISDR